MLGETSYDFIETLTGEVDVTGSGDQHFGSKGDATYYVPIEDNPTCISFVLWDADSQSDYVRAIQSILVLAGYESDTVREMAIGFVAAASRNDDFEAIERFDGWVLTSGQVWFESGGTSYDGVTISRDGTYLC